MTAKDKIKKYLDSKGISKNKFSVQTGLSVGFLDSGKSIGADKIKIIINTYPDLSLEWLVLDEGDMIKVDSPELAVTNTFKLRTDRLVDQQEVPLFEMEAAASILSIDNSVHKQTRPTGYLSIPNLPPCDGGLFIRGDSMYPLLKSGDIVLYKRSHNLDWLIWGEMYLISFTMNDEDYIVIKYINKIDKRPDEIRLVSYNEHHAPMEIPMSSIRAIAMIKASVRYHTMG